MSWAARTRRAEPRRLAGALLLAASLSGGSAAAVAAPGGASVHAFGSLPSRFRSEEFTLGARSLGEICHSRGRMPDGTVCNPAYLHEVDESFLMARIYLGNGYEALSTANRFLYQPLTREFLQELFQQRNVTSVEGNLGVVFTAKHFSAEFHPYKVQYFSELHNPNFPVVAVHAAVERGFAFASGFPFAGPEERPEWSAGARLRLVSRDYVHGSFSLFQALAEEPRELLPNRKQKAAWLEPSIAWRPRAAEAARWGFRASVMATHLGAAWPSDPLYAERADLAVGVGIEPWIGPGQARAGLDLVDLVRGNPDASGLAGRARLGLSYQYGILEAMTGVNASVMTAGLQFSFSLLQAGVAYEYSRAEFDSAQTESRISTEFAVRL